MAEEPEKPAKEKKRATPLEMRKDRIKMAVKTVIEHARGVIRGSVFPKDQIIFLDPIDKIQSMVIQESRESETILKSINMMRDTARRVLRPNPSKMMRIINELDAIETGVVEFIGVCARIPRS